MRWILLFRNWENCSDLTLFLACNWFMTKARLGHGEFLLQQRSPKGCWWSELFLTQLEEFWGFWPYSYFVLLSSCLISTVQGVSNTAFPPLLLPSPLGVSCFLPKKPRQLILQEAGCPLLPSHCVLLSTLSLEARVQGDIRWDKRYFWMEHGHSTKYHQITQKEGDSHSHLPNNNISRSKSQFEDSWLLTPL